ncbi:MAG: tRNA (adenosine(37)-N6)-threonylcarbamoyltransferase complex transferase subunit TsaD [Ignavibacteriae bacterium]|nr:tRNA (adenosine(37)-N6)-threonylcarbamoyltransferase complex transferase subunit TsaD [Ignavibacteriota bacterium]MCB9205816.1 tRNA (adenosine(37)-N6)-threonylcarbamoyltransferase complex transferase subunit TsaD [Ignavibacteriales bacterium]MCB9219308.1 tRNA (adenosine(37)-N6)-threonylcarbamoyltransferase complex transferase subunit TsaD [Ignavibacteriales bacterium]MCB9260195.1 tRNA (adenosine(37)-N6)-threonylcarbamoyltransferase complex transferase subunit TsaD [Ignavibacteriales bacterium
MIVLGIESSCDETSVAILENDNVKANLISSQHFHKQYGGVIPELSSRAHLQQVIPLIKSAFSATNLELNDIDVISATAGPGLIGALLVGLTFGKSLALSMKKPFVPVNHIEGHIFSGFLMQEKPEYPFLCSVVSGGHTLLLLVKNEFEILRLGTTIDDAIGEAFDKVSKMIGLGYPGGPLIQKYAEQGNEKSYSFPIGKSKNKYDFSYSGLKTAVLREIQNIETTENLSETDKSNIAASFQKAAVEAIMRSVNLALQEFEIKSISLVGGVAANKQLRNEMVLLGKKYKKNVVIPDIEFCGDNAAMIALRGLQYHKAGKTFPLSSNAYPSLPKDSFMVTE